MRLIFVRHVETVGNVEHRFNGVTESDYTEKGRQMKASLVSHLYETLRETDRERLKIFTSPITRARYIAEELAEKLGMEAVEAEALKEFHFGIFDGLTVEEAEAKNPDAYRSWIFNHLYVPIPEGDSYEKKFEMTKAWLDTLLSEAESDATYVFIAHGAVLRCALTAVLDLPLEGGWHLDLALGGYAVVDYEQGYGILRSLNPFESGGKKTEYRKNFKH